MGAEVDAAAREFEEGVDSRNTYSTGELFTLTQGYAFKSSEFSEHGVPALKIGNVKAGRIVLDKLAFVDESYLVARPQNCVTHGDIIISLTGNRHDGTRETWVGKVAQIRVNRKFMLNQRVGVLRPLPGAPVDPRFFSYLFASDPYQDQFIAVATSSGGQANLSTKQVLETTVDLPSLPDQHRIAAVLGALDDKIELNRKMNRTLEEMAQALFKSWFIDFDGVPPEDLMDSELCPTPRGWEVTSLRDHITLDKGLSYKGKFLTDTGVPMVNLKCIKPHGGFRRDATKPYSGDFKPRHVVQPGDLIIANTDLTQARDILGCPAIVPPMKEAADIITSHHTFAVRFAEDSKVDRHFLYQLLLSPTARQRCRGFATGTTVLAVPRDALLDFQFPLPPAERRAAFEDLAGSFQEWMDVTAGESESLIELRDTLIPKLISGEIRIPDAEDAVEAIA